jgi:hypothetical protein
MKPIFVDTSALIALGNKNDDAKKMTVLQQANQLLVIMKRAEKVLGTDFDKIEDLECKGNDHNSVQVNLVLGLSFLAQSFFGG